MVLIDVHCHLSYLPINSYVDKIIKRAIKNNVVAIINCGTEEKSNRESLELAKKYNIVKAALGFYPTYCEEISEEEFDKEIEFIEKNKDKIIALSEIGLDYKNPDTNKEKQRKCFEKFIQLSEKIKKPLIVHSRNAELEVIEMLESSKNKNIVMHCFSGRKHLINRIIDNKWYFSIPCTIIKLEHFQNIVKLTDSILTETDAPFLSPFKGKSNEPSFITETIKKIAEVKNTSKEEVEKLIYKNYQKLFK
ncbi:MAG: TatD family hydrolase [Nanoarchaeota archaeon]